MDQKEELCWQYFLSGCPYCIQYYLHCLENKQKGLRFLPSESLLLLIKNQDRAGGGKLLFKGKALT